MGGGVHAAAGHLPPHHWHSIALAKRSAATAGMEKHGMDGKHGIAEYSATSATNGTAKDRRAPPPVEPGETRRGQKLTLGLYLSHTTAVS